MISLKEKNGGNQNQSLYTSLNQTAVKQAGEAVSGCSAEVPVFGKGSLLNGGGINAFSTAGTLTEKGDAGLNSNTFAEAAKKKFADCGCRVTHQRLAIFQALANSKDHPSAEMLLERVAGNLPMISLETVYRTLNKLTKIGLINRVYTLEKQGRFDADVSLHHHVICRQCHSISDLRSDGVDLNTIYAGKNGWGTVESVNLVMVGVCRTCLDAEEGRLN